MSDASNLTEPTKCAKIDPKKRKIQIFSQIVRHLTALVYLLAELYLGEKPEKL